MDREVLRIKSYLKIGLYSSLFFAVLKIVAELIKIPKSSPVEISVILLDFVMVAGLVYGISKRSRICAILFAVYFFTDRVYTQSLYPEASDFTMVYLLAFGVTQLQGLRGIFGYHRLLKKGAAF